MSGVTSTAAGLLIIVGIALAFFASPLFVVPAVLIALAIVALGPIARFIAERGDTGSPEPTGVPTTGEAAYDPISRPGSHE
jgi:hypothetical protein